MPSYEERQRAARELWEAKVTAAEQRWAGRVEEIPLEQWLSRATAHYGRPGIVTRRPWWQRRAISLRGRVRRLARTMMRR